MEKKVRILHIDDNVHDRLLVREALQEETAFELTEAKSREELELLLERSGFDIVLSDFNILGLDGLQVLKIVKGRYPNIPVIIVTGTGSEEIAIQAMKLGAADYVIKTVNHIRGLASTIKTVLEHTKTEILLQKSEERFRLTAELTGQLIYDYEIETGKIHWEGAITKLTGYTYEEFQEVDIKRWEEMIHPEDRNSAIETLTSTMKEGVFCSGEYRFRTKNDSYVHMESNGTYLRNQNGKVYRMLGSMRDITERKEMEKKIFDAIIMTEEKERTRLAQDLHDDVGPLLSGINLYLSSLCEKMASDERAMFICSKIRAIVKDAVQNVRDISSAMNPKDVADFGLHRAISNFVNKSFDLIEISFSSNILDVRFESCQEIVYYRIIKELINNTLKHADAKHIDIQLNLKKSHLFLSYKDDGVGTDVKSAFSENKGIGLNNIISRIRLINGNYTCNSTPGKGFIFELSAKVELVK